MRKTFIAALLLLANLAGALNKDSLKSVLSSLPENVRSNPADTTACYLMFELTDDASEEDLEYFSIEILKACKKNLAAVPVTHPSATVYKRYAGYCCNVLGLLFRDKGNMVKAIDYEQDALRYYEELNDGIQMGITYNNIGIIYYDIGENEKALEYLLRSYKMIEKTAPAQQVTQAMVNIGYLLLKIKRFDEAIDYFNRGLKLARDDRNEQMQAEFVNCLGLVDMEMKRYDKAYERFTAALAYRRKINDVKGITTSLNNIGNCLFMQKKYPEALKYSLRSMQMSRELKNVERMRQAAHSLKENYEAMGQYRDALKMHELYIQMRDSTSNENNRKMALSKKLEYDFEKKEIILKEEQERIKSLYEQKQSFYGVLGAVLVLLSIILFYSIYLRYKFKKEKESKNLHIELKERLKQEIREKEGIANSIIHIQEQEREKLAAELHDGVNQLLFAAKIQMQTAKTVGEEMHRDAVKLVETAIQEIKSIAGNQGSFLLDNKLLADALTDLTLQMKGNQDIRITFLNYGLEEELLNKDRKIHILRIIQELLNNTIKHSGAQHCYIAIKTARGKVLFSVTDTGAGMDNLSAHAGNGLKNISNRVSLLKGRKRLFSLRNKGTKAYIEIPLS